MLPNGVDPSVTSEADVAGRRNGAAQPCDVYGEGGVVLHDQRAWRARRVLVPGKRDVQLLRRATTAYDCVQHRLLTCNSTTVFPCVLVRSKKVKKNMCEILVVTFQTNRVKLLKCGLFPIYRLYSDHTGGGSADKLEGEAEPAVGGLGCAHKQDFAFHPYTAACRRRLCTAGHTAHGHPTWLFAGGLHEEGRARKFSCIGKLWCCTSGRHHAYHARLCRCCAAIRGKGSTGLAVGSCTAGDAAPTSPPLRRKQRSWGSKHDFLGELCPLQDI